MHNTTTLLSINANFNDEGKDGITEEQERSGEIRNRHCCHHHIVHLFVKRRRHAKQDHNNIFGTGRIVISVHFFRSTLHIRSCSHKHNQNHNRLRHLWHLQHRHGNNLPCCCHRVHRVYSLVLVVFFVVFVHKHNQNHNRLVFIVFATPSCGTAAVTIQPFWFVERRMCMYLVVVFCDSFCCVCDRSNVTNRKQQIKIVTNNKKTATS